MFNSNSTPFTIPLSPAGTSNGNGNNGNGWGDNGAWWIVIIILFLAFRGWGDNGNNGNGGNGGMQYVPYAIGNTDSEIQRSFDTQAIQTKLDAMTNGMCQQGYQNQQGFHDVDNAVCQLGYQIQGGVNDLNTTMLQGFNSSNTAMLQGFNATNTSLMQGQNAISSQISQCCCEEREAIQGVNYNMSTQACAIQNTMNNNTRDILEGQNAGFRSILDYLCNQKIEDLQSENQTLKLAASQQAQNNYLVQALHPSPVPAFSVPAPYPYAGYPGYNGGCCNC